jgi:siroheme synthase
MPGTTPAALVQAATTGQQRLLRADLATLADRAKAEKFESPALALIGSVAAVSETLAWFAPGTAAGSP